MAKLIFKSDMKLIAKSGEQVYSSLNGVYKVDDGFVVTFLHGGEHGEMALKINEELLFVEPDSIRSVIYRHLKVNIPETEKLYIYPCYPKRVRQRYGKQLRKNKTYLLCNNWDDKTRSYFCDKDRNIEQTHSSFDPRENISVVIGKDKEIDELSKSKKLNKLVLTL